MSPLPFWDLAVFETSKANHVKISTTDHGMSS